MDVSGRIISLKYLEANMDRDLYQRIVAAYRETGSVDRTAEICGTYAIKVRKVLITEGLWHSKKSDAVNARKR